MGASVVGFVSHGSQWLGLETQPIPLSQGKGDQLCGGHCEVTEKEQKMIEKNLNFQGAMN